VLLRCFSYSYFRTKVPSDSRNDLSSTTCVGQAVELQRGCREVLLGAVREGVATHVVSVNWSSTLLRAALAAPAEPQPQPGSRHQEAASSVTASPQAAEGTAAAGDSQAAGAAVTGSGSQSAEELIQQQLGPEAGLSEEDKEAPVPDTAAAYQVIGAFIRSGQQVSEFICDSAACSHATVISKAAEGTEQDSLSDGCSGGAHVDLLLPASCRRELKAHSAAAAARRSAARLPTSPTASRSGELHSSGSSGAEEAAGFAGCSARTNHAQEGMCSDNVVCRHDSAEVQGQLCR
jgi:hypothetical protein